MNKLIPYVLVATILLKLTNANFAVSPFRLPRASPNTDLAALKKPVIDPLTEEPSINEPWERCMIVAPMTIQILGQLLVVSSKRDVSFEEFSPNRIYKYIRNPQSLRATLVQISNDGYQAFLSAHSTMNVIQLKMLQIPKNIKTALKLLGGDLPAHILKSLLPQILGNLRTAGNDCVKLANNTKNEFSQAMLLIGEVIEVTTTTQSLNEDKVRQNKQEIVVLRTIENGMKQEEELRAKRYQEATQAAKKAEETYYTALKEIPTGFEALLQDFSRAMLNIVPTLVAAKFAGPAAALNPTMGNSRGSTGSTIGSDLLINSTTKQTLPVGHGQTLVMMNQFSETLQSFIKAVSAKTQNDTLLKGYVISFETFRKFITELPDNTLKNKAINLIQRVKNLAANAATRVNQKKPQDQTNNMLINQLNQIAEELKPFLSAAEFTDPKIAGRAISSIGNQMSSIGQDSSKNELFKAQLAQANLAEMKRIQEEQAAAHLALLAQMRNLSSKMVAINFATIQYEEIIAMLKEALKLLARLRTQWSEFVLFFGDMSAKVESMVQGPLQTFLQISEKGVDTTRDVRQVLIDALKDDTFGIHRHAYILFVMSRTYYEISTQYLMSRLAGLSNMLTANNDAERSAMVHAIEKQTNSTLAQIEALVHERKKTFDTEMKKREGEVVALISQLGGQRASDQSAIKKGQKLNKPDDEWGEK